MVSDRYQNLRYCTAAEADSRKSAWLQNLLVTNIAMQVLVTNDEDDLSGMETEMRRDVEI